MEFFFDFLDGMEKGKLVRFQDLEIEVQYRYNFNQEGDVYI